MALNFILAFLPLLHPFYVSVTAIEHNKDKASIEITCRIFFDDLEDALSQENDKRINILESKDSNQADKLIQQYLSKYLTVQIDGKTVALSYLGYEIEEDAAWCYLTADNIASIGTLRINNRLLYSAIKNQTNIIHATVNGERKSYRLTNPASAVLFDFR